MRQFILGAAAAVLTLGSWAGGVWACFPSCSPCLPKVRYQQQLVTCYRTEYRTEYREVRRVVQRQVPEVRLQEVQEQVSVPSYREETRQRTVMVPVTTLQPRERTVMRTEWREEVRQREVPIRETRLEERSYTAVVPEIALEQRQEMIMVPEVRHETRMGVMQGVRPVPGMAVRPEVVCAPVPFPFCDPYTGRRGMMVQKMPQLRGVPVPTIDMVPEQRVFGYTASYLGFRPESRTVTVPVPSARTEMRTERVPVTTFRREVQTYTVRVPVCRPEIVTEQVPVTVMQPQTESYVVRVPECRTEIRVRKVPVTEYRTVTEEVVERVPVTTCVQVPYQVLVSVPVVGCP